MDQVIPGLWIGGLRSAQDTETLKANQIFSILSVMRGKISIHETFIKHQILLDDSEEEDILIHLLPAITFIQSELDKGRGILVHCQAGVSRSATIVAAYLMHNRRMSPEDALDLVRKARPEVDPNPSFIAQLEIFHKASFAVSRKDKGTRMYYMERTTEEVMNGDGSLPSTDMFARFPRQPSDSTPSTPGGRGPRRRIRCKMCRQELAAREHMLDHGQLGPATPVLTPASSRRPSTTQPQPPSRRPSRYGSDSRPRRPSGLSFANGLSESLAMSTVDSKPTLDNAEEDEGEPTARPRTNPDGTPVKSPPLTATPTQRRSSGPSGDSGRPSVSRPFAGMSRSMMETLSMSALDSDDEDEDEDDNDGGVNGKEVTNIRLPPGMSPASPNSSAQVATHLGRRMSDAMLTSPTSPTSPRSPMSPADPTKVSDSIQNMTLTNGATSPPAVAATSSSNAPGTSTGPSQFTFASPPLASPTDLAAQLYANPKLAALRGGNASPGPIQTNVDGGSGSSGGSGSRLPVSPPILMNPKCSGYFVEPMKWMEPFLEGGEIAGKIVCPNKKCGTKLGNYDWAGVCCGCKEWVTPGFCISRSKVDEIVA